MNAQCPIHDSGIRCRNQTSPECKISGRPGQGFQLEEFTAEICRHHYAMLSEYHRGISMGSTDPELRN